jgi:hypothetical protein
MWDGELQLTIDHRQLTDWMFAVPMATDDLIRIGRLAISHALKLKEILVTRSVQLPFMYALCLLYVHLIE